MLPNRLPSRRRLTRPGKAPPLVRPDRQIVYADAATHYDWPDAKTLHDRDTITVDRITADIDGPAHRFVIKRGDTVEVYISNNNLELGTVTGISHAKEEVRVSFTEGSQGGWYNTGRIYPAIEPEPKRHRNGQPLSKIIAAVNDKHGTGLTEADRVPPPAATVTPAAILAFLSATPGREFTTGELRHEFACPGYDPAKPLQNPVHKALRELRDSGQVHVIEPAWGEPRFSVLRLPPAAELTLHQCPLSLSGPELRELLKDRSVSVPTLAARLDFTQRHVEEVLARGLSDRNAILDWLQVILEFPTQATRLAATPKTPYTFDDFKTFHREFHTGSVTFESYREQFQRLHASQESLKAELLSRFKAKELAVLASRFGSWDAKRSTKDENAAAHRQRTCSPRLCSTAPFVSPHEWRDL